ncbi:MAG: zinc ABC transporter substrate-binding protein [Dehalococcoidia bacterium]|nr:zinc ABC transporter substrate-binding protein [Dehalococcoidia bacterium]
MGVRAAWLRSLLGLALAGLAGVACNDGRDGPAPAPSGGRVTVVATIAQVGALARAVAGDLAAVRVLVGPGVDPHDHELTAGDRKAIDGAAVIFRNGLGIDGFLDKAIDAGRARVVTVTDGLALRTGEGGEPDPHVWHDPDNDRAMVARMAEALAGVDGANAAAYRQNAAAYAERLTSVDAEIRALVATIPPANRKLVTNHDSLGYFIGHYGFTYVGAVIPGLSTAAEPSAKDIARLEDLVKKEGVKAIFAESSVDPRVAQQVAADTGVRVVDTLYGDSLGASGSGAETVDGMLLANARMIAEALR